MADDSADWEDDPLSVADRDAMLEMEVVARGEAFDSLEDRWAAEDHISDAQAAITEQTTYIHPPEPAPISIDEAKISLEPESARFVNSQVVKEYVNEYQGIHTW